MLRLFRLIRPYRGYVVVVLILALAQSIGSLLLPRLMSDIVDKGIVRGDTGAIVRIGAWMLLLAVAATGCAIARRRADPRGGDGRRGERLAGVPPHQVPAPARHGDPAADRVLRVQLQQLQQRLPADRRRSFDQ